MKQWNVQFHTAALNDLLTIYDWVAEAAGSETAVSYIQRLERYCQGFCLAPRRGTLHDDVRPGLRIVGFERRVTIAFVVEEERVTILRLFYGGQDWRKSFEYDPGSEL